MSGLLIEVPIADYDRIMAGYGRVLVLDARVRELGDKLRDADARVCELEGDLEGCEDMLGVAAARADCAESELRDADARIARLDGELENARGRIAALEGELAEFPA